MVGGLRARRLLHADRLGDLLFARLSLSISTRHMRYHKAFYGEFTPLCIISNPCSVEVNSEPGLKGRIASNHASVYISDSTLDDAVYRRFND